MNKQACPCCGFLTLERLASSKICYLCFWEEDGQGEEEERKSNEFQKIVEEIIANSENDGLGES